MDREFLTLKEFARKISYSERQVRQMCIDGKIQAKKITDDARKWLIPASELERLKAGGKFTEKTKLKPHEEEGTTELWEEFVDLIEQFNDSLSRISAKDWVVWDLPDATWIWLDRDPSDKHPAELKRKHQWPELEVELKLEAENKGRFRSLLLRLQSKFAEFIIYSEWRQQLTPLIKKCKDVACKVWHDAETATSMKMAGSLAMDGPNEGLQNIPKFIYDFAVDNYESDSLPSLKVAEHKDGFCKLVPADDPQYILAIGSQGAMETCEKVTLALCERYARDQRIGIIKEEERKVKDQATIFQGILSKVLADLAQ